MHFFFIPLAKAVSVCYISAWRPEVSHISFSIFCPPSAWQAALFIGLGIFSFWPALATIVLRFTAASNHWLLQHMLSANERSVDCFLGVNLYLERFPFLFPFAPFCLIYFVSSTCFELMWEGRKKMLMISVAIGFSKRLETHDTTCFNLKDVS